MALNPLPALRELFGGVRAQVAPEAGNSALTRIVTELVETPVTEVFNAVQSGPANPQSGQLFPFGFNDGAIPVTHAMAFMQSAVWACIDVTATALAASDWNVYGGVRGAADKQALPGDGLQYVLNTRLNPDMTAQAGKRALGIAAAGYGNGYAEIERDLSSRIIALWPISPDRVEPRRNEFGQFVYRVTQDYQGGFIDLDPSDVFHVRGGSLTGFAGDDMVAKAIKTISRSVAVDQFAMSYFANGTQMGGVLEYPNKLDDPTYERLKTQINEKHKGARNAFRTLFLEAGAKYTQFNADADDSQLVEVKNQIIEEVCRWFRVPPHKIAHLLRATNNNIEHQGLEFSRDTLRPWVQEIQQEGDYKLIPVRGPKKFLELDVDWAEQGDYKSRADAYSVLRACGVFSVDDVLRKLGENTIGEARGGNLRTMNGAAVRLEDVGKNLLPAPAPPADRSNPDEAAPDAAATATAWLTSVYARIQRRLDNGARDMQAAGHADWQARARKATQAYAKEHVDELSGVLGARIEAAQRWALEVINGCEPTVAANAAMESE